MLAAAALLVGACGGQSGPAPDGLSGADGASTRIEPARIDRVRAELPDGYEVAGVQNWVSPAAVWGFRTEWQAEPSACGTLADPAVDPSTARGWSGSGAGGIVYAAVARSRGSAPDPAVIADCARWTMSGGQATGSVALTEPPGVDAETVAMAAETRTVVEGGTETRAHAETVTAYLADHVVYVVVVTDPGSPNPQLGREFASALMIETVSTLRGAADSAR
ncbi:DUF5642 family protein [Mycolicibacterium sp. XJ1819]